MIIDKLVGSLNKDTISSKGNQLKFENDGKWYKADYLGYEGASEYFVSELLKQSNYTDFVAYDLELLEYNGTLMTGCVSQNFLQKGENLITVDRLCKLTQGKPVAEYIETKNPKDKIERFVNFVSITTDIPDFGAYLTTLMELDSLTLNDDRHFNNIAVIEKDGKYRPCPIFDNGGAYLSDMKFDYPINKSTYGLIQGVEAKPFCEKFDKQVDICRALYGSQLSFLREPNMQPAIHNIQKQYGHAIANRIEDVYSYQKSYCQELFNIEHEKQIPLEF